MKSYFKLFGAAGVSLLACFANVTAASSATEPKPIEIKGEIIDTWCYLSGVMGGQDAVVGTAHHTCALWCAAGGIPVGVLDEDGQIYMVLKLKGEDTLKQSDSIMEIQSDVITAKGLHYVRDGVNYLIVEDVIANDGISNFNHEDYGSVPPNSFPKKIFKQSVRDSVMKIFKNSIVSVSSFLVGLALSTSVSMADDFSAGSNAKEFGLEEEVKSTFSAKVVDMVCEIAGDCSDNCGNGERQLGLVRDADNKLISVLKNGQFSFNGAAEDLLPYCNKMVEVDGLMIGDPEEFNTQFYMVQLIREAGSDKWNKANRWTKKWAERNPEAKGKGPWFRRDPRVKKQIEATGYFGLGKEADIAYAKENQ